MSVFLSNVNIFLVLDPYCCCLDLDPLMASGTVLPKGKLWHFNTAEFRIRMDPVFFSLIRTLKIRIRPFFALTN